MITVGGKPELCCGMARCDMAKWEGRVYTCSYIHYTFTSLVQNALCKCCALCKKAVCVKWLGRKTDIHERIATQTSKKRKYEEVRWSLSRSMDVHCRFVLAPRKIGYGRDCLERGFAFLYAFVFVVSELTESSGRPNSSARLPQLFLVALNFNYSH